MVAGHLQEKKGYYYAVLTYKNADNKAVSKWVSTKLPVKGNKKRAEAFLQEIRANFTLASVEPEDDKLFSDYIIEWLEMARSNIELSTYCAYHGIIHNMIAPYFSEKMVKLTELQPKHLQKFYSDQQQARKISSSTLNRYHAVIRKSLQYAMKTEMIPRNPATLIDPPKNNKEFVGKFYAPQEINSLLDAVRGTNMEIPVFLGAMYGLRRSEILGLKWSAINFDEKTISVEHTVTEVKVDGQRQLIQKDRTKTKASRRTLPLIPEFEVLLEKKKLDQKTYRDVCKSCYNNEFLAYVCVDEMGNLLKPGYISQNFQTVLKNNNLRKIRFHDLRHTYATFFDNFRKIYHHFYAGIACFLLLMFIGFPKILYCNQMVNNVRC